MPYHRAMVRFRGARASAWLVCVLVAGALGFGYGEPTEAELDYSKRLYGEAEEAMAAEQFAVAKAKYIEGYRYAPSLHIFTLNIATAADAEGDCAIAKKYFQHFLDLVPDHDQRGAAKKRLTELKATCTAEIPTAAPVAVTPKSDRKSRKEIEAERALNVALSELDKAYAMYASSAKRFSGTRQIARASRRKKRHAKRMRKLMTELGVEIKARDSEVPAAAKSPAQACREGRGQESRVMDAMDGVLKWYDDNDTYRVMQRFIRWSERIDRPAFEECT